MTYYKHFYKTANKIMNTPNFITWQPRVTFPTHGFSWVRKHPAGEAQGFPDSPMELFVHSLESFLYIWKL